MELKKLDKSVLKLWYIRAAIGSLALVGVFTSAAVILSATGSPGDVTLAVLLGVGIPVALLLAITLIMPSLRYKMYTWGYDDKRIIVKQGVIFRQRVVIPVCQIQDLHRTQGPLMMMLKLSGVTISTAGSNFDISTLTTAEADRMIDELERNLEARIEELRNEEI
ncbi:MAG: PH domain-containing protein [Oscillospiraceae bacterium]|nr:PH domain-containing protein [Oscillospiraceae bacterium]